MIFSEQWGAVRLETVELREICLKLPQLGNRSCATDPRVGYWSDLPTVPSAVEGSIVDSAIAEGCDLILVSPYEQLRNKNWLRFEGDGRLIPVLMDKERKIYVFKIQP